MLDGESALMFNFRLFELTSTAFVPCPALIFIFDGPTDSEMNARRNFHFGGPTNSEMAWLIPFPSPATEKGCWPRRAAGDRHCEHITIVQIFCEFARDGCLFHPSFSAPATEKGCWPRRAAGDRHCEHITIVQIFCEFARDGCLFLSYNRVF
jgi:hypothetical protein